MLSVTNYRYDENIIANIKKWNYGENWPSVYIFYNDKKAYVGESLDVTRRTEQHLQEREFDEFTDLCLISNNTYNKSVILDLESFLIKYLSADGSRELTNGNAGVVDHNYFYKEAYDEEFKEIWNILIQSGIAKNSIRDIENSELFKYSPYKSLNREQMESTYEIIKSIADINNACDKTLIQVIGGAGTGKTILAVYLIKLLVDIRDKHSNWAIMDTEDALYLKKLSKRLNGLNDIGFVVPMIQLRETIKSVFNSIEGLCETMVISPEEATHKMYDLLVVDEAHRLYKRRNLPSNIYKSFDKTNQRLMGDSFTKSEADYTELDWIIKSSRTQILFYDSLQSIRHTDIGKERFTKICNPVLYKTLELHSQMRCKGGNGYYEYVRKILEDSNLTGYDYRIINNYSLQVFDSVDDLYNAVIDKDAKYGLCKVVTGPGWSFEDKIIVDGRKLEWVKQDETNASKKQDETTVWSIHKIQGFDLNYAGVIFGKEIYYDTEKKRIDVKRSEVMDRRAKPAGDDEAMRRFVLNIYLTLMTRGIRGIYIYAMDKELNEYLKKYFAINEMD